MEYALAVEATIPAKGLFINYVAIFWAIFNPPLGYIVYEWKQILASPS